MVKQTYEIVWDRNALDNLKEILSFLSKQSKQAPKIVKGAILIRIEAIKSNPLICEKDKLKEPTDKNFRAFVVYSYRISYQINPTTKEIRILRVRHTSREPIGF